jgi:hypothetical protein
VQRKYCLSRIAHQLTWDDGTLMLISKGLCAMCFSASASFIAGTSLCAFGVATLKKTEAKTEIPFAKPGQCP